MANYKLFGKIFPLKNKQDAETLRELIDVIEKDCLLIMDASKKMGDQTSKNPYAPSYIELTYCEFDNVHFLIFDNTICIEEKKNKKVSYTELIDQLDDQINQFKFKKLMSIHRDILEITISEME